MEAEGWVVHRDYVQPHWLRHEDLPVLVREAEPVLLSDIEVGTEQCPACRRTQQSYRFPFMLFELLRKV